MNRGRVLRSKQAERLAVVRIEKSDKDRREQMTNPCVFPRVNLRVKSSFYREHNLRVQIEFRELFQKYHCWPLVNSPALLEFPWNQRAHFSIKKGYSFLSGPKKTANKTSAHCINLPALAFSRRRKINTSWLAQFPRTGGNKTESNNTGLPAKLHTVDCVYISKFAAISILRLETSRKAILNSTSVDSLPITSLNCDCYEDNRILLLEHKTTRTDNSGKVHTNI